MGKESTYLERARQRFAHLTIHKQIVIGNAIIIIIGAIGGTLITRQLTDMAADVWLIFLFASVGTVLVIVINGWIIKAALRPLRELSQVVNELGSNREDVESLLPRGSDPDIRQLAGGLNSLVVQLDEHNRQLKALSKRAISAQEEERKRIARSLHDDTGQALTSLIISLERIENKIPLEEVELRTSLDSTKELAKQTLGELRQIIHGLRPTMLDDLGLVPAIRWYARSNLEGAGIRVKVASSENIEPLSPELKIALFRIAQEAINNIIKHSHATSATVTLHQNGDQVKLCIQDDGHGFDVQNTSIQAIQHQKWGLLGIEERADLLGGIVIVDSHPQKGTKLEVIMPQYRPDEVHFG
jgi:two-component system sensor histidine kinase UhpB